MVEYRLKTPISEEDARKLNVGDIVYITGKIYTARDQAHRRILEYADKGLKIPVDLNGSVIFHVGPIVKKQDDKWIVISAGPTTSTRMNLTTPKLLENLLNLVKKDKEVLRAEEKLGKNIRKIKMSLVIPMTRRVTRVPCLKRNQKL